MKPGPIALCACAVLMAGAAHAEVSTPAAAAKLDLPVTDVPAGYVKVDGFVTDWTSATVVEARTLTRGEEEYDWTGPRDCSLLVQAQADREFLYLAIEVRDNVVVGPKGKKGGDRVEVWIDGGEPAGSGRIRMIEIGLGEVPDGGKPSVRYGYPQKLTRTVIDGVKSDGSMRNTGYFFEVGLPLSALSDPPPGVESLGVAIIARDWDYDDANEDDAAVATAPFDGRKERSPDTMGRLKLPSTLDPLGGFFRTVPEAKGSKVLGAEWVQVGGDARRERVALLEKWIVVAGRGVGDVDFYYYALPHGPSYRYESLETRDLTGDGGVEFLVRYTVTHPGQIAQQFLAIYRLHFDSVNLVFLAEVGNTGPGWSITNEVTFESKGRGKPSRVLVHKPVATGATKANYTDVDADLITDWDKVLVPWRGPPSRSYEWQDTQFIKR